MTREEFFTVPGDPEELRRRFIVLMGAYEAALAEAEHLADWVDKAGRSGCVVTYGEVPAESQWPAGGAYRFAIPAPERAIKGICLDKSPKNRTLRADAPAEVSHGGR